MLRKILTSVVILAFAASAGASSAHAQDQTTARPPLRVGGAIKAPTKVKNVEPVYPEAAQKARTEGIVILDLLINESGAVQEATVLRSVPTLDEPALEAVLQWVYVPTLLNGEPVSVLYTVTIAFSLK
jgi:TonB family protein